MNTAGPTPKHETQEIPVIRTRSSMRPVSYHALFSRSTIGLACALAASFVGAVLTASQPAPTHDLFDDLFVRTTAKRESIRSIRATFVETTTSSLLQKPLVANGTVVAAPPGLVSMTYRAPDRHTVTIDGQSLAIEWPDRREQQVIDIANTQKRIEQYFAHASIAQLRSMFDISAAPDATVAGTIRVDMRPKRKQVREGLERLELWIDRDQLLLSQLRMTFPGGDQKTIRLEDVTVNVPIAADTFHIPR
jgi:outer membrane lipoprotein-sorting protein